MHRLPARLIPNRLRKYRLLMGLEQLDVAFLLGLKSHARISQWEQGRAKPSLENLLQLSIVYRTLPDELYYDLRRELAQQIAARQKLLETKKDEGG